MRSIITKSLLSALALSASFHSFADDSDLQKDDNESSKCHFSITDPEYYYSHEKTKFGDLTGEHWKLVVHGRTIASKKHEIFGVTPHSATEIPPMRPGKSYLVNGVRYYLEKDTPRFTQRTADWEQKMYPICTL